MSEKLQKILARAGVGSRREMERWIEDGRVILNGKAATLGDRADESDRILIDGKPLAASLITAQRRRVLIYHKPIGEVTTRSDPEGRKTVFDHLPRLVHGRWIAIGRLDINTIGLLIFTTDGELANRLMHPSSEIDREYAVRVLGEVSPEAIKAMQQGVELDDGLAHFESIQHAGGEGANQWYHVTLKEGKNREVRRLWESQGMTVSRLVRVRYGPIALPRSVKPGRWEELDDKAMKPLLGAVGLTPTPAPRGRRGNSGHDRDRPRQKPSKRSESKRIAPKRQGRTNP